MPRIGGDGGGGGGGGQERISIPNASDQNVAYGGGWFANAAKPVTSSSGNNYVVLGGTRYGLRLSQDSLPPTNSSDEFHPEQRRKRESRDTESRERLTEGNASGKPLSLDFASTDCCCIGLRSGNRFLPLNSRIPLSWSSNCGAPGSQSAKQQQQQAAASHQSRQNHQHHHHHHHQQQQQPQQHRQTAAAATAANSNNSRCWPSGSSCVEAGLGSSSSQGGLQSNIVTPPSSSSVFACLAATCASSPSISSLNSSSSSQAGSSSAQQQLLHHTLPRLQLAKWTKHQSLRLQEPAVTAVDRLQRFRWSGGGNSNSGGNAAKKNNTSGRSSDKTERLRELTEKLKGSAPVPPPRRPSRIQISSPDSSCQSFTVNPPQQYTHPNEGRFSSRSYTFSEGSTPTLSQGSKLPSPSPQSPISPPPQTSSHPRLLCRSESIDEERDGLLLDPSLSSINSRHSRQYSDSIASNTGSSFEGNLDDGDGKEQSSMFDSNEARDALVGLFEPRSSSLHGTVKMGQPYRSASFGQADSHYDNSRRALANSIADSRRAAFAATGGNGISNNTVNKEARASTLPRVRHSPSPRASSPSFADSAVGSSAEIASFNADDPPFRPGSDGSDSLATSSAIGSPELVDKVQRKNNSVDLVDKAELTNDRIRSESVAHKESRIEPHEVIITPPQEDIVQSNNNQIQQHAKRLSQASEASEAPSETSCISTATETSSVATVAAATATSTPTGKLRRYRGDTSKRRKGVYITQWPEVAANDAELKSKLSAQSSDERDEVPPSATPSDLSDCEGHAPQRYSKRPLRGPYGLMLEAEMAKPRSTDLVSSDDSSLMRQRRKVSANLSFNASSTTNNETAPAPCHHRTISSPSKLEGLREPSPELLAELLRGSSERVARISPHANDTRTHVVVELYDTERSYVEALQILVNKYLQPLKSSEYANLVDAVTVDEIFYQVPSILAHHEVFLEELRKRLESWELRQTIGDVFLEVFTKPEVLETYTLFLDNWKSAKKAIKTTCQAKPAFTRFLETMEREHKGKLGLDQLLIKPVQRIPRYELLIQRLLKHTESSHPDYDLLTAALREVHELVVKINCTERESLEWEQQQSTLREVQSLVEGLAGIVTNDRAFIRHDLVSIASNQGTRKERGLFLFSDLLVITSIKRRSGTIRKPSTSSCPNSLVGILEGNKYKMLMRIPLDDLEVMKAKDENLKRMAREVEYLREDCAILNQLQELTATLHGTKQHLEEMIKDMLAQTQKQLSERNAAHSQLACLELTLNTQTGVENISVMFAKPDKRTSWEETFNEAKQKLAAATDRRPVPEFVGPLPIRKTRAGLQFTCAAPTLANSQGIRDVWVCNSDGYVGQVCVLSLTPETPQVTSCNGVCNARILCVAGIPACTSVSSSDDSDSDDIPCLDQTSMSLDASNFEGSPIDEDFNQPTMWLGTEDGCIHVYNCTDNIRIKKNKVKLQHSSSVYSIIYLDNKVFISLANGDVIVYSRDHFGGWNTNDPFTVTLGTVAAPVTKMLAISGKLWCSSHNQIKILNTYSLEIEHIFNVSADSNKAISCMASSGSLGVWVSLHNSAVLKLFHASSYDCLADVNIAPAVTNMLANCDDIIRQHKAACLRVTALLACNDLLWIGTSAGVLLTVPIPPIKTSTQRMSQTPVVTGIPHGHTGQVRFLTCVEIASPSKSGTRPKTNRYSLKGSKSLVAQHSSVSSNSSTGSTGSNSSGPDRGSILVISGGDGYEDFRGPQASAEFQAGREDSTNHLLLWKV